MKATLNSREENIAKLTVDFTAKEWEDAVQNAYTRNKGKFNVDGFRKGKAPRKIIESHYGSDVFYEDAINELFNDAYPKALSDLNLTPIARPQVEFDKLEKDKDFSARISVEVRPDFEVKDYKGVKIEKVDREVTDEDMEKEMENLRMKNSRMIAVDRPAANGDSVLLDYAGFVGDEQFEGGTAERQVLKLGSGTFIPGFEEQLVGAAPESEVEVKVTFPEEYHAPDLAGKEAVFKCKVHEVKETEMPELNDDFAKDTSEFDTFEELKEDLRTKLAASKEKAAEKEERNRVVQAVVDAQDFDIPKTMIDTQIEDDIQEYDQSLRNQGMNLDQYLQYLNSTLEDFKKDIEETSIRKLKTRLVMEEIIKNEDFEVTDKEIDEELENMAKMYNVEIEKVKEFMQGENLMYMYHDLKFNKAVDFLFENAVIE
mgnify:CR=1 FL=1